MQVATGARYKPGDQVRVLVSSPRGHIRTPAYIQGKAGQVELLYGAFRNPESLAYGGSGLPKQPLYRVQFDHVEVWGKYEGSPHDKLCVDIYEHWLEPA